MHIEQEMATIRSLKVDALIANAKGYAEANYEEGYDFFVECYEDREWYDFITRNCGALKNWADIKKDMDLSAECYSLKFSESGCDW